MNRSFLLRREYWQRVAARVTKLSGRGEPYRFEFIRDVHTGARTVPSIKLVVDKAVEQVNKELKKEKKVVVVGRGIMAESTELI